MKRLLIPKRSASWIVLAATLGILAQIGGNAVNAAENIVFPRDAGIVNVKDYGAKGDGVHDDTAAIQRALDEQPNQGAIVYLPNGTYRISDTLKWPHGPRGGMEQKNTTLQGQSRDRTIIRLQDACPGYDDPKRPKALIGASRRPAQQFRNAVRNLTIDSGRRNPGAVGLQFIANNQGGIRDVTIRSGDGRALVGLDLAYTDAIGPLLVRDLKVVGFDIGIKTAHAVNSMTFEHITLEHQNRFGFVNQGPCVSIRDLTSRNAVPALINAQGPGLVTLVDATLYGHRGANAKPAIFNEATLFARNIKAVGYVEAIHNAANEQKAQGLQVAEFVSHPILSLFPAPLKSLGLPVPETPEVPWDDPQGWASPTHFGARPDDEEDDTQALQKAIDSGKTTLYLPRGGYVINGTVLVRGNVRRIIGCEARVEVPRREGGPAFKVVEGRPPVVVFERIHKGDTPGRLIDNASRRTLVLSSVTGAGGAISGRGDLFLEDVDGGPWAFQGQRVWARQLNVETPDTKVLNDGGTLWVLGYKTERGGTLVATRNGGKTEVLGGLCNATSGPKTTPMFLNDGSSVSITIGESCSNGQPFQTLVSETRGGLSKTLPRGEAPTRTGGSLIPLYIGVAERP